MNRRRSGGRIVPQLPPPRVVRARGELRSGGPDSAQVGLTSQKVVQATHRKEAVALQSGAASPIGPDHPDRCDEVSRQPSRTAGGDPMFSTTTFTPSPSSEWSTP